MASAETDGLIEVELRPGQDGHLAATVAGETPELALVAVGKPSMEHLCLPFARQHAGSCCSATPESAGAINQKLTTLARSAAMSRCMAPLYLDEDAPTSKRNRIANATLNSINES
jgi:hypothetical protein